MDNDEITAALNMVISTMNNNSAANVWAFQDIMNKLEVLRAATANVEQLEAEVATLKTRIQELEDGSP